MTSHTWPDSSLAAGINSTSGYERLRIVHFALETLATTGSPRCSTGTWFAAELATIAWVSASMLATEQCSHAISVNAGLILHTLVVFTAPGTYATSPSGHPAKRLLVKACSADRIPCLSPLKTGMSWSISRVSSVAVAA
jgi:hypothetical protein